MDFSSLNKNIEGKNKSVISKNNKLTNVPSSNKSGQLNKLAQNASNLGKNALGMVSNVGHIVAKVAGGPLASALEGSTKTSFKPKKPHYETSSVNSKLQSFYQNLGGSSSFMHDQIDTQNTFECKFYFQPNAVTNSNYKEDSFIGNLLGTFFQESKPAKKEVYDPVTGKCLQKQSDGDPGIPVNSYKKYEFDFGMYIQKMTIPNMVVHGSEEIQTMVGKFPTSGTIVQPDNNTIQMEFLNLREPVQDKFFYPWMRETTLSYWVYDSQPYTTAQIVLDFSEHSDLKYVFIGCRPTNVQTIQPTQEPASSFTRQVTFAFNYMFIVDAEVNDAANLTNVFGKTSISSGAKTSTMDKIASVARAGIFSGGNILKM